VPVVVLMLELPPEPVVDALPPVSLAPGIRLAAPSSGCGLRKQPPPTKPSKT
jgi:hypothetical protein